MRIRQGGVIERWPSWLNNGRLAATFCGKIIKVGHISALIERLSRETACQTRLFSFGHANGGTNMFQLSCPQHNSVVFNETGRMLLKKRERTERTDIRKRLKSVERLSLSPLSFAHLLSTLSLCARYSDTRDTALLSWSVSNSAKDGGKRNKSLSGLRLNFCFDPCCRLLPIFRTYASEKGLR